MRNFLKKKHNKILLAIIVLALILRLVNIGWSLDKEAPGHTYYPDEPYGYMSIAQMKPLSGEIEPGSWSMIKGPLFFEIAATANQILSAINIQESLFPEIKNNPALIHYYNYAIDRFINLVLSLLLIFLIFFVSDYLFENKTISLMAAFIYSIFPHTILFSNIISGDILASLLTLYSLYFAFKAHKTKNNKLLTYAAIWGGLATTAKYTAGLSVLPIITAFILLNKDRIKFKEITVKTAKIASAFIAGLIIGMPGILFNFKQFINGLIIQKNYQTGELIADVQEQLHGSLFYFTNIIPNSIGIAATILILLGTGYYFYKNKKTETSMIIASWLIPYYIVISMATWLTSRYTVPLMPIFAILTGYAIITFYKNTKWKKTSIAIISIALIYSLLFLFNFMSLLKQGPPINKFIEYATNQLELSKDTPEILYINSGTWDKFSFPIQAPNAAIIANINEIKANPLIEIPTKYILIGNIYTRNARRINDKSTIKLLDKLENSGEFKLEKTFRNTPPIKFITKSNPFYPNDLLTFFPTYYLYKKTQ